MPPRDAHPDIGTPGYIGICDECGKRCYETKRDAKRIARQLRDRGRLNVYRCGQWWHLGHLPVAVVHGDLARSELRGGRR